MFSKDKKGLKESLSVIWDEELPFRRAMHTGQAASKHPKLPPPGITEHEH
jgi:hypothetical protein